MANDIQPKKESTVTPPVAKDEAPPPYRYQRDDLRSFSVAFTDPIKKAGESQNYSATGNIKFGQRPLL